MTNILLGLIALNYKNLNKIELNTKPLQEFFLKDYFINFFLNKLIILLSIEI